MGKSNLIISLFGYAVLLYITALLPFHLYEPARNFNLPNLLWMTHLLLLYIHEAGHLIFSLFGRTMYILGGSLNQVLVPAVWYIVAKREGSPLSHVAVVITGISLVDVSVYVKDAGMLLLPLIGGLSKSHHDWATLFNEWGLIEYAYFTGEIMFWSGMGLALFGIYSGVRSSMNRYRLEPIE